jgi:HD-like signal output (HDOD) protein
MQNAVMEQEQSAAERNRAYLLQKLGSAEKLPALGSAVTKVVAIASSDDEALQALTTLVLSDVALTQKILRLSNTISYRTTADRPITTVTGAIFMLGFDAVKSSALAVLLVEHLTNKQQATAVRHELAQAMCASVFGKQVAQACKLPSSEEAGIAALFKNLGPLLVASHAHELYLELRGQCATGNTTIQEAAKRVIGCSLDSLARTLMQDWGMHNTLIHAVFPTKVMHPHREPQTLPDKIAAVAAFSAEAASLLVGPDAVGSQVAASKLMVRYGVMLNLKKQQLDQLISAAMIETNTLLKNVGLTVNTPPAEAALAELPGDFDNGGAATAAASASSVNANAILAEFQLSPELSEDEMVLARYPSGKPLNAQSMLLAGVQDISQQFSSGRSKLNDMLLQVLETMYQGLGFRFATICMKDIKSGEYRARMAIGHNSGIRQAAFIVNGKGSTDLFQLALANNADLLISDATVPKIASLLPAWHKDQFHDTRSFVVLPLVVRGTSFGLIYGDRALPAPEGISTEETALIKTLKSLVLTAVMPR